MAETPTKISVFNVNGEKMSPSAITVPRSFTKHAARMALPYSVTLNPSSSITAYTTATEVVESATPASQLDMIDQCNRKCATAAQPRNGFTPLGLKDGWIKFSASQKREHDRPRSRQEADPLRVARQSTLRQKNTDNELGDGAHHDL
jgi:hypothetical protein